MDLARKLELAREVIASIAGHDAAAEADVHATLLAVVDAANAKADTLAADRATRAGGG